MDLDGDGHVDILSGSWPGELFLFRGGRGRTFAAPETIQDKDGNVINIGGGILEQDDGSILITGKAKFEQTPEGVFVTYHGKRLKSTPEKPISVTGTASAAHATDWDGDGDLDLIVGDIEGKVYLVPNEGAAKAYAFGKEQQLQAGGKPLQVAGDAGPFAADWDGDGDLDLLVGAGDGTVSLFRNTGSATAPQLAAAEQIVPQGHASYGPKMPADPCRGLRAKVCAADWNGDGRLDLLLGDLAYQKPSLPKPTPEQEARFAKLRERLEPLRARIRELMDKLYGPSKVREKGEREKLQKEANEVQRQIQAIHSKLPPEYETHGWVWLFLRKPEGAEGGKQ